MKSKLIACFLVLSSLLAPLAGAMTKAEADKLKCRLLLTEGATHITQGLDALLQGDGRRNATAYILLDTAAGGQVLREAVATAQRRGLTAEIVAPHSHTEHNVAFVQVSGTVARLRKLLTGSDLYSDALWAGLSYSRAIADAYAPSETEGATVETPRSRPGMPAPGGTVPRRTVVVLSSGLTAEQRATAIEQLQAKGAKVLTDDGGDILLVSAPRVIYDELRLVPGVASVHTQVERRAAADAVTQITAVGIQLGEWIRALTDANASETRAIVGGLMATVGAADAREVLDRIFGATNYTTMALARMPLPGQVRAVTVRVASATRAQAQQLIDAGIMANLGFYGATASETPGPAPEPDLMGPPMMVPAVMRSVVIELDESTSQEQRREIIRQIEALGGRERPNAILASGYLSRLYYNIRASALAAVHDIPGVVNVTTVRDGTPAASSSDASAVATVVDAQVTAWLDAGTEANVAETLRVNCPANASASREDVARVVISILSQARVIQAGMRPPVVIGNATRAQLRTIIASNLFSSVRIETPTAPRTSPVRHSGNGTGPTVPSPPPVPGDMSKMDEGVLEFMRSGVMAEPQVVTINLRGRPFAPIVVEGMERISGSGLSMVARVTRRAVTELSNKPYVHMITMGGGAVAASAEGAATPAPVSVPAATNISPEILQWIEQSSMGIAAGVKRRVTFSALPGSDGTFLEMNAALGLIMDRAVIPTVNDGRRAFYTLNALPGQVGTIIYLPGIDGVYFQPSPVAAVAPGVSSAPQATLPRGGLAPDEPFPLNTPQFQAGAVGLPGAVTVRVREGVAPPVGAEAFNLPTVPGLYVVGGDRNAILAVERAVDAGEYEFSANLVRDNEGNQILLTGELTVRFRHDLTSEELAAFAARFGLHDARANENAYGQYHFKLRGLHTLGVYGLIDRILAESGGGVQCWANTASRYSRAGGGR